MESGREGSAPPNIVVTGSAGSVGRRVASALAERPDVGRLVLIDVVEGDRRIDADWRILDLRHADLKSVFEGADTVVHLASSFDVRRDDVDTALADIEALRRVLDAAAAVGVRRVVLLSSAMVYGAWRENPVPLTEAEPLRPNPEFAFAQHKAEVERMAAEWRDEHPGTAVVVLRPTTAVAEGETSWVARTLRAATAIDAAEGVPQVQFLHLDDLASAAVLGTTSGLDGVFNVAPDGSVSSEDVRELDGKTPRIRLPEPLARRFAAFRWRHRLAPTPPGIVPYTMHPWVVANDRLRGAGWEPTHTNEQAYVAGYEARPWAMMSSKRRQQLAFAGVATVLAVVALVVTLVVRRIRRRA